MIKTIRNVLIVVLALVFCVSLYKVIKINMDYKKADIIVTELRDRFVQEEVEPTVAIVEEEGIWVPISVDFENLLQENEDVVGWIYSHGTPINYPVVKGDDNNQYLYADLKGQYLSSGTIFADFRNGNVGEDPNYVLYGHNMANTSMFGTLLKYKEQAFYDAHSRLFFFTPECDYVIDLCAGSVVADDSDIFQVSPQKSTIKDILENSTFISKNTLDESECIITLSTCTHEFETARYVVIGNLKKIDKN